MAYVKSKLLDDSRIFASSKSRIVLALGARAHHLARAEYESGGTWRTYTHDHGGKTFRIELGISREQRDLLQFERAAQIHRAHYVSILF